MEIKEIVGREIKINANSITVRNEEGKTCGVVRNVTSLYNIQANKQFDINSKLRKSGIRSMDFDINKNILIKDDNIYFIKDLKKRLHHEKYGFFSEYEKEKYEEYQAKFKLASDAGYDVLECNIRI